MLFPNANKGLCRAGKISLFNLQDLSENLHAKSLTLEGLTGKLFYFQGKIWNNISLNRVERFDVGPEYWTQHTNHYVL